jgi:undecaprenyl-diphosphatase
MTGFQSILLGILQGLTEFIPVSSTAHLLIAQKLLGIPGGNAMFSFLVIIQLGTLLSLMVFFWKDILQLIKAFFARPFSTQENKLGWYIIIATIPALLAGYLLKSLVETIFNKPLLEAAIRLLITAVVLVLVEGLGKRNRSLEKMNWLDALIIGIAQIIAIFPGASRSGTTISAGMARGLDRPAAARFAFLMSIPVMLAAGGYQSLDVIKMSGIGAFLTTLVVGFVVAAVVGWFTVKWLLGYLSKHSLYLFALYCAVAGAVSLIIYLLFP